MRLLAAGLTATLLGAIPAGAAAPANGTLTIEVSNVRVAKGRVHLDVCPEKGFLKSGCPYQASSVARQGMTTVIVPNVAPGRYAVQVFLDENDNGQIDRNFLGIPREGFGFSNNPVIHMSAPSFEAAAFSYAGGDVTVQIKLKYVM